MFDLETIRSLVQPFIIIFSALIVSGAASSVAVQILKLDWFPLLVSKYPRITNILISSIASIIAIYTSGVNVVFLNVFDYIAFTIGTIILSAFTYRTLLRGTTSKDGTRDIPTTQL